MGLVRTSGSTLPSAKSNDTQARDELCWYHCQECSQPYRPLHPFLAHRPSLELALADPTEVHGALQEKCQWNQLFVCQSQPAHSCLLVKATLTSLPKYEHSRPIHNACTALPHCPSHSCNEHVSQAGARLTPHPDVPHTDSVRRPCAASVLASCGAVRPPMLLAGMVLLFESQV